MRLPSPAYLLPCCIGGRVGPVLTRNLFVASISDLDAGSTPAMERPMVELRKPIVLLDVDGVINALGRGDRSAWRDWTSGAVTVRGEDYEVVYSPTVVATIRRWHESGLADVRWLADWGDAANRELRRLTGLPAFPVIESQLGAEGAAPALNQDQSEWPYGWWKDKAVQALVAAEPHSAIVWLDDELRDNPRLLTELRTRYKVYALGPNGHLGLSPRQLREIEQFLSSARLVNDESPGTSTARS